ncbi:MAG: AAA family ATPase, partial [Bacteroidetes bacterium]|nr:AAA family ATPase [Bacteroidota bacterium]
MMNKKDLKYLLPFSFITALSIIFGKNIIAIYDTIVVIGVLDVIKSAAFIDCGIILFALTSLVVLKKLLDDKKRITKTSFCIITFSYLFFLYYRYVADWYWYSSFYFAHSVKYIDIISLIYFEFLAIAIYTWKTPLLRPKYHDDPFIVDSPITDHSQDLFGRNQFAIELAKKIQSEIPDRDAKSLAIGINGEWGSGKTSFCNLVHNSIDGNNRVIINFNPWRSSTPTKIIEDFFSVLIGEVQSYDVNLSNKLSQYSNTLTKIDENTLTKAIDAFVSNAAEDKGELYESINQSIKETNKQFIIFIDDLDRLDKKEIVEVLRIIRNTADFNNIVYIVSYDKGYVEEAIKEINKHNYTTYLEKIFQFEFTLPPYDFGTLRDEIKQNLENKLPPNLIIDGAKSVDYASNNGTPYTNRIVFTKRDV